MREEAIIREKLATENLYYRHFVLFPHFTRSFSSPPLFLFGHLFFSLLADMKDRAHSGLFVFFSDKREGN